MTSLVQSVVNHWFNYYAFFENPKVEISPYYEKKGEKREGQKKN